MFIPEKYYQIITSPLKMVDLPIVVLKLNTALVRIPKLLRLMAGLPFQDFVMPICTLKAEC